MGLLFMLAGIEGCDSLIDRMIEVSLTRVDEAMLNHGRMHRTGARL